MTRSFRAALRLSPLLLVGGILVACSADPDEAPEPTAATTSEAITRCAAGYDVVVTGVNEIDGRPIDVCMPTAALHTGVPTGTGDTCGGTAITTPASLPASCTLGTLIDGEPVFACPTGTTLPASLGLVSVQAGVCRQGIIGDAEQFLQTCERVVSLTSLHSNCLGSPLAGWELVVDNVATMVSAGQDGGGEGGGCPGGCALVGHAPVSSNQP